VAEDKGGKSRDEIYERMKEREMDHNEEWTSLTE